LLLVLALLVPFVLVAVALKVYETPGRKPFTVSGEVNPLAVDAARPILQSVGVAVDATASLTVSCRVTPSTNVTV
jgi:hypothetical protein